MLRASGIEFKIDTLKFKNILIINRMPRIITTKQFIERAKLLHKGDDGTPLYDYTKSTFIKSAIKTTIICLKHGDFEQSPNSHISGHGCKKCANELIARNHTLTNEIFLERCEKKFPNLIDYTNSKYEIGHKKTEFKCRLCNTVYMRTPGAMLSRETHGCPICVGGFTDNCETFIAKAKLKHGEKFNYDLVEYVNSLTKVKIKCPDGHIFEQTPNHHLNGDGCRRCRGYYRTQEDFEIESKEIFPSMFDYSKTKFIDMSTPVILICSRKHEFTTIPTIHFRESSKGGCIECAHIEIALKNSYTQEQWIELANIKHGDTYLYDKVKYINSQTNVHIICSEHGEFEQTPASHLSGQGCPKCAIKRCAELKLYTDADIEEAFTNARIIHNKRYEYLKIFRNKEYLMIELKCPTHGIISQRLDHHLHGHGCMRCVPQYSKQQIEWLEYCSISKPGIQHAKNSGEYRIPGTVFMADGFHAETNTIYEYQGDFWHGNPLVFSPTDINPKTGTTYGFLYEKTKNKIEEIKSLGYKVVEIWERDWEMGKKAISKLQIAWRLNHA